MQDRQRDSQTKSAATFKGVKERRKGQRRMSWGEGSPAPANDEIQGWGQAQSLGESWCIAGSKGHAGGQIVCSQRYAEIPALVGTKGWKMLTYTEL